MKLQYSISSQNHKLRIGLFIYLFCFQTIDVFCQDFAVFGSNFRNGLTPISKDFRSGYMDKSGKVAIGFKFDWCSDFDDGLAIVMLDKVNYIIDAKGDLLIRLPENYYIDKGFNDGIAVVEDIDKEKYGAIDRNGQLIIPFDFEEMGGFFEGVSSAKSRGKWGLIDKKGKSIIPFLFENMGNCSDGMICAVHNGKCGYINKSGNVIIPFDFDYASDFSEGLAGVGKNGRKGFIDRNGKTNIPFKFEEVNNFSDGLATVYLSKSVLGFIDRQGNFYRVAATQISNFQEGLAKILDLEGYYGFINNYGDVVLSVNPKYSKNTNSHPSRIKSMAKPQNNDLLGAVIMGVAAYGLYNLLTYERPNTSLSSSSLSNTVNSNNTASRNPTTWNFEVGHFWWYKESSNFPKRVYIYQFEVIDNTAQKVKLRYSGHECDEFGWTSFFLYDTDNGRPIHIEPTKYDKEFWMSRAECGRRFYTANPGGCRP